LFYSSLYSFQSIGCWKASFSNLFELLPKQKAETITKGVAGSTGRTIPTTPIPRNVVPKPRKNNLLISMGFYSSSSKNIECFKVFL